MALVDDLVTYVLLASIVFFVVLALALLLRYRQAAQKINASVDLGHDLWQALEQRMKKQDERILDVMGRLEVVQSRVLAAAVAQAPVGLPAIQAATPTKESPREVVVDVIPPLAEPQRPESQHISQESQESHPQTSEIRLDETQLKVLALLGEGSKNTRQLTDAVGVSREHMARLMKDLFEVGVVARNDATKPFVYQLTDLGRQRLLSGPG